MRLKNQQRQESKWAAGRAARRQSSDGNGSGAGGASAVRWQTLVLIPSGAGFPT